jgi:hypothetical protein
MCASRVLTEEQAYAAMFHYLEQLWERTKSDDLGGFLGSMCLLQDGGTADPAVIHEWAEAVDFALKGGKAATLTLTPPLSKK